MSVDTKADAAEDATTAEDLAEQLGDAIAETPEYQAFEETKAAVEDSEEAQQKVREFEQLRQEFMLARQTGEATQEDVQKVREAQQDLHSMPVMAEYLDAQERLEDRLQGLNEAISSQIAVDFGEQAGGCCQDE